MRSTIEEGVEYMMGIRVSPDLRENLIDGEIIHKLVEGELVAGFGQIKGQSHRFIGWYKGN